MVYIYELVCIILYICVCWLQSEVCICPLPPASVKESCLEYVKKQSFTCRQVSHAKPKLELVLLLLVVILVVLIVLLGILLSLLLGLLFGLLLLLFLSCLGSFLLGFFLGLGVRLVLHLLLAVLLGVEGLICELLGLLDRVRDDDVVKDRARLHLPKFEANVFALLATRVELLVILEIRVVDLRVHPLTLVLGVVNLLRLPLTLEFGVVDHRRLPLAVI